MIRRPFRFAVVALLATACTKQDAPKVDLGAKAAYDSAAVALSPASKVALDSGNVLFRAKLYEAALAQYRVASKGSPGHAAPLFGMYMVARATNNPKMADSVLAEIRAHNAVPPHELIDTAAAKAGPAKP